MMNLSGLEHCFYTPQHLLSVKIIMVGVVGTTIAIISFLANMLLCYLFWSRKSLRNLNGITYLAVLAIFDVFMSISYVFIMSVATYADWAQNFALYKLWHDYLRVGFTFAHVTMTASTYLIIAATIERYCEANGHFYGLLKFMRYHKWFVIALSIGLAILFKGMIYFEVTVTRKPECAIKSPFMSVHAAVTDLATQPFYDSVWRFWARNLSTIFIPFILLLYCNFAIVCKLYSQTKEQTIRALAMATIGHKGEIMDVTTRRRDYRAATRLTVMVVCCYLISSVFSVIITAWEHIDADTLLYNYSNFHTLGSDAVSLLTILSCALRLPIYALNNRQIRRELKSIVFACLFCRLERRTTHSDGRRFTNNSLTKNSGKPSITVHQNPKICGRRFIMNNQYLSEYWLIHENCPATQNHNNNNVSQVPIVYENSSLLTLTRSRSKPSLSKKLHFFNANSPQKLVGIRTQNNYISYGSPAPLIQSQSSQAISKYRKMSKNVIPSDYRFQELDSPIDCSLWTEKV